MTETRLAISAACHACALTVTGLEGIPGPNITATNGATTLTIPRTVLGSLGLNASPGDILYLTLGLTKAIIEPVAEPLIIHPLRTN